MSQYKDILDKYHLGMSMNRIAEDLSISPQVVRRALITAGRYNSPKAECVQLLHNKNMPVPDIAASLRMSNSAVASYLPYSRGPRKDWEVTENALKIRECREKKKQKSSDKKS